MGLFAEVRAEGFWGMEPHHGPGRPPRDALGCGK